MIVFFFLLLAKWEEGLLIIISILWLSSKESVSIAKENNSVDSDIGAALAAQAIIKSTEAEERYDSIRPRPRSSSIDKKNVKEHAKSYLASSSYANHSQQELVQKLKGPKLRSWILQIPPTFPREGKWTTFDATFEYFSQYFNQHGPVRKLERRYWQTLFTLLSMPNFFFFLWKLQFDGIIGFSLGGQIASFLVKVLAGLGRDIEPAFKPARSKLQSPSFVIFASVMPIDPISNNIPSEDLHHLSKEWSKLQNPPTKVLSIWGTKDKFFSQDCFEEMSKVNHSTYTATFPFGHSIPNKWVTQMYGVKGGRKSWQSHLACAIRDPWPSMLANWMAEAVHDAPQQALAATLHVPRSNL